MPIDPPFRSRFQARYIDGVEAAKILGRQELVLLRSTAEGELSPKVDEIIGKMAEVMASLQIAREMRAKMASGVKSDSKTEVPLFPQTTLVKLARFLAVFPPPADESLVPPKHFLQLLLVAHPALAYAGLPARRALEEALSSAGFPASWIADIAEIEAATGIVDSEEGIFGWRLVSIERRDATQREARLVFSRAGCADVAVLVPAGALPFSSYPPSSTDDLHITPRFTHLLTSLFQLHALSTFDISFVPSAPTVQSSSASTSLVLSTFSALLGYELESVHLYKELGGRELWMRRVVGSKGGVTGWEPAPLVHGAKAGRLVWLDGVDTLGPTFNSLSRLLNDREGEMWEGRRLTLRAAKNSSTSVLDPIHPAFRVITTASKATPPAEWLTEQVAATILALPTIPMPLAEERALLLAVGCPASLVDHLELFAQRYRTLTVAMGSKSRRLGTASLVRIAKRLARFPDENLRTLLERALLVDFLPNTERTALADLFDEVQMKAEPTAVRYSPFGLLFTRTAPLTTVVTLSGAAACRDAL